MLATVRNCPNRPQRDRCIGGLAGLAAGIWCSSSRCRRDRSNETQRRQLRKRHRSSEAPAQPTSWWAVTGLFAGQQQSRWASNLQEVPTPWRQDPGHPRPAVQALTINDGASIIALHGMAQWVAWLRLQAATTLGSQHLRKDVDVSATGSGRRHPPRLNFTTDSDQPNYRSADPNGRRPRRVRALPATPNTLAFPTAGCTCQRRRRRQLAQRWRGGRRQCCSQLALAAMRAARTGTARA